MECLGEPEQIRFSLGERLPLPFAMPPRTSFYSILAILCLLAGQLPSLAETSEEWPRWRGPEGKGVVSNDPPIDPSGGEGLEVLWAQPVGGGYAGVTVAEGRVYTMDRQGETPKVTERILCFEAESGEPLWAHSWDADYEGLEYGSGPRASVTIHGQLAYAIGANGNLSCLDAASGEVKWSIDTIAKLGAVRPKWGFAASPVIWKDTVIVPLGIPDGGGVVAFDRQSGEERWRSSSDPAGYATPIFTRSAEGEDRMVLWTPKHVQLLNPNDGTVLWEFPYENTYGVAIATPLVRDGIVFVSSYWHGARALQLADGKLIWEDEMLRGLMSCPLYLDGTAYLLERENGFIASELSTGKKLWDDGHLLTPADRNPQASIVHLGDTDQVLALNANGELIYAKLGADGIAEHWREQLTGKTWAHPGFDNSRIYARDDRRLVAAKLPRVRKP